MDSRNGAMCRAIASGALLFALTASHHRQTPRPFAVTGEPSAPAATPFADNNGLIPPQYNRPLFKLSHDYPALVAPLPAELPWRKAIGNGEITVANAGAYAAALKDYVAPDMRLMLTEAAQ